MSTTCSNPGYSNYDRQETFWKLGDDQTAIFKPRSRVYRSSLAGHIESKDLKTRNASFCRLGLGISYIGRAWLNRSQQRSMNKINDMRRAGVSEVEVEKSLRLAVEI